MSRKDREEKKKKKKRIGTRPFHIIAIFVVGITIIYNMTHTKTHRIHRKRARARESVNEGGGAGGIHNNQFIYNILYIHNIHIHIIYTYVD